MGDNSLKVLFFSRGRGKAHAIPDLAIASRLRATHPEININFVSYGAGAAAIKENRDTVIDIGLPEDSPFLEILARASGVIRDESPTLVLSHEEFAAMPAGKIAGLPCVFLTHWFASPDAIHMQALAYADQVLFMEQKGVFPEPPYLRNKTVYLGPVLRELAYSLSDRDRARKELALPADATVISVFPGGWFTEQRAPVLELVLQAFDRLPIHNKWLVWIAGQDYAQIAGRCEGRSNVSICQSYYPIEKVMVATNVAITKGTYVTGMELYSLGIPSISLSMRANFVDEILVSRIPTNVQLHARDCDSELLLHKLERCLKHAPRVDAAGLCHDDIVTTNDVADRLSAFIRDL